MGGRGRGEAVNANPHGVVVVDAQAPIPRAVRLENKAGREAATRLCIRSPQFRYDRPDDRANWGRVKRCEQALEVGIGRRGRGNFAVKNGVVAGQKADVDAGVADVDGQEHGGIWRLTFRCGVYNLARFKPKNIQYLQSNECFKICYQSSRQRNI